MTVAEMGVSLAGLDSLTCGTGANYRQILSEVN